MQLAVSLIHGYRRWISPYKGFRCAHHVVFGTGSCSDYGLEVFQSEAFWPAWLKLRSRLKQCGAVNKWYHIMKSDNLSEEERRRRQQNQNQSRGSGCGDCDPTMGLLACDLASMNCDLSALACDASACDLGGCDVDGCL